MFRWLAKLLIRDPETISYRVENVHYRPAWECQECGWYVTHDYGVCRRCGGETKQIAVCSVEVFSDGYERGYFSKCFATYIWKRGTDDAKIAAKTEGFHWRGPQVTNKDELILLVKKQKASENWRSQPEGQST